MGKNRQAHEIVEELMAVNGIDEKTLAEKAGVSELVIRNYLSGLNKDSRSYARLKDKVKEAFGLGEDFFDESHVFTPTPVAVKEEKKAVKKEKKPVKSEEKAVKAEEKTVKEQEKPVKDETKPAKQKVNKKEESTQLVFDLTGQISEETKKDIIKEEKTIKASNKDTKKQSAPATDALMTSIKGSGSKAKLSSKKKDITPEAAAKWADEYEEEMKQSVGKAFSVLKESLKEVFKKEESKPSYSNKKITEIVELASKAKEDDLNLIIAMLRKITK